jgi:hypothetical protein
MDSSLSCASIEVVVKRVETFGGGVWAQELFFPAQNFEIPSHDCGKLYGGLTCKACLVVQASLNFGEEQTMVNAKARLRYCTNRPFYSEKMKDEREKRVFGGETTMVQMVNLMCFHGVQASTHSTVDVSETGCLIPATYEPAASPTPAFLCHSSAQC